MKRLVTWNVNHRMREKAIPAHMSAALLSLEPDVIVLTEFVPAESRQRFYDELAAGGLSYRLCSAAVERHNHVLIISKTPLEAGDIFAPQIAPAVPSNALHVRLSADNFEILGIRIPDFSKAPALRRACWDWILQMASAVKERPFIILGDFNTDARYPKARCGDRLAALVEQGWQHCVPAVGASYWALQGGDFRIDHAFASNHFEVLNAAYVKDGNGFRFAGTQAMSDHAALVVEVRERKHV